MYGACRTFKLLPTLCLLFVHTSSNLSRRGRRMLRSTYQTEFRLLIVSSLSKTYAFGLLLAILRRAFGCSLRISTAYLSLVAAVAILRTFFVHSTVISAVLARGDEHS